MYELIKINEKDYYVQCPAKIGIVRTAENEVCLIDSGNDKDAAKKALRHTEANGWNITAVYNTHSHADHIGGNKYLQAQTGCRIYASGIEQDFTRHPILEPAFLFGGYPPDKLRHKFLMAQESDALPLTADSLPHGWELIPLPGHSFDMVGFRTESDTVYLADSLSSVQTLDKYGVGFIYDVAEYIRTLERIMDMQAAMFVPSHAEPTDNIAPLAEYNLKKVLEIAERVRKLCAEPICFDSLLTRLFDAYSMTMTVEQYALVGSTLRSYLAYLTDKGEVETVIQDNSLMWKKA